jgi:hypothetical protein
MPDTATIDFLNRFGIPVAILSAIGLFLWRGFWPWFVKRQESIEKSRQDQIDREREMTDRQQRMQETTMVKVAEAIDRMAKAQEASVKAIVDEMRTWRRP